MMNANWKTGLLMLVLTAMAPLALAQDGAPDWHELTEEQQQVLAPFAERWASLDADRRENLAAGATRWAS
ncbi:MAG: DUF3106 domain-containing protein, partial [Woeseia sp.]